MDAAHTEIPAWVVYPQEQWLEATPAQAGFDADKFTAVANPAELGGATWEGEVHGEGEWGAVLTRGGYLLRSWGNPDYCYQTASVGKAFTRALVGLAVREGLIDADDEVRQTWTGEDQLSHPHKYLNQGHHQTLTWRHLVGPKDGSVHCGGFPVTNGFFWRQGSYAHRQTAWDRGVVKATDSTSDQGRPYPEWAQWTGDPHYDNYAHAEPGTVEVYSSGGIWRLSQALTALWDRDIKEVLDEKLFGPIGIAADRWDWLPGQQVHDQRDFYPTMPGYADFVDEPYAINGHLVRGGGGWASLCAKDLARFALLVATGGIWQGQRLIDDEWVRSHGGGNASQMIGDSETMIGLGIVTTAGLPDVERFKELIVGPIEL